MSQLNESGETHEEVAIHLAKLMLELVEKPLTVVLFLLVVTLVKSAYYKSKKLQAYVPESCILIVCGLLLGIVLYFGFPQQISKWTLSTETLFLVMLPPIMLESAYGLYDRTFFDNIGSILLYAVVGTLLAFSFIGLVAYGIAAAGLMGLELSLLPSLLFSSFIVAVDPVAVLAIFQDIGVDRRLYLLVFGESLLNDGVTVVLYNVMKALCSMDYVGVEDVFLGVASFFTVALGGLTIGLLMGALTALLLRFAWQVRVMEISVLLGCAYLSYLLAMLFDWSGIISIISCGLMQMQYALPGMHEKSRTTSKYLAKLLALLSESLIFMYLGLELMTDLFATNEWNTGFCLWELFLCVLSRFCVVFSLTAILNYSTHRLKKITITEQVIMGFGGLRGAIAFALVTTLDADILKRYGLSPRMFNTATLFIILITTVLFGILTKPLVKLLKIRLEPLKEPSLITEFNDNLVDHVKHGIEAITGRRGTTHTRTVLATLDDYLIKPLLQRQPVTRSDEIIRRFEKVAMKVAFASLSGDKDCNINFPRQMEETQPSGSRMTQSRGSIAAEWVLGTSTNESPYDDSLDLNSSIVDLSGLQSQDTDERLRTMARLRVLMHQNAPSGVPQAKLQRHAVDDVPAYLQELKRKRKVMYMLYRMQQKTMSRTNSRGSLSESAASMSLPRPKKLRPGPRAPDYMSHSLPRPNRTQPTPGTYVTRTLDRPQKRQSEGMLELPRNRTRETIQEGQIANFDQLPIPVSLEQEQTDDVTFSIGADAQNTINEIDQD